MVDGGGKKEKKAWSGRFSGDTDRFVEELTASIGFDKRLYRQDIKGSIAHCRLLEDAGIITSDEEAIIVTALNEIEQEITSGSFQFSISDEDIHMNIERRLVEKTGPVGEKLHTGRSRNDQVVLDIRMYLKDEIADIHKRIEKLKSVIVLRAKENIDVIMPGYTHLQPAQPVLFSHYLLAYYEMIDRDGQRFEDCLKRIDIMPLGSGALAGSNYNMNRVFAAELLGFTEISKNSIDAVSDRDFAIEFVSAASILMMHLSRLSEDMVIWSSSEFGIIELPDRYCTGSSIMPQKKNPDVPELVRGKSGRVFGNLVSLLTVMKGLPLSYNKDMQEDKEPIFDTVDTIKACLRAYTDIISSIEIKTEVLAGRLESGYLNATEIADYLVNKGLPFRSCHEIVGNIVRYAIEQGKQLLELSMDEYKSFSGRIGDDIHDFISMENSIARKNQPGSTSRKMVLKRIKDIEQSSI